MVNRRPLSNLAFDVTPIMTVEILNVLKGLRGNFHNIDEKLTNERVVRKIVRAKLGDSILNLFNFRCHIFRIFSGR